MSLFKVQQPLSLKQQAYEGIKNAIINHIILPGEVLYERSLSENLGISRTPIREAIPLLELEGWVTSIPRKGTFVSTITERDVEEVIQIRRAIEVLVIELLIPIISPNHIQKLEQLYSKQVEEKQDNKSFISTDKDFHIYLAELSGNRRLVQLMQTISDQIRWFGVSALHSPNRTEQTLKEHALIIECLKNKDVEKAKKAVLDHIECTRMAVLSSLKIKKGEKP
ncbi:MULTISPECIES: GntR family transcriptional regulator [Aneurinibacillus]|uniref:DNA-binding transcriptional regulator, GntR family n=1 Tax=Aneurinibacillus thermoaerophilus TaxID=143495 RepID=A0A1G8EBV3_ANETH|nr:MULTISPECIES: GntR family transcriptional regulator [Aneurinibacillus]AMA72403.1 GntR family transcriptional regulator [Aneurinibacillus sp. XH2]MED0676350.1 GntR family transcriptional regulator [Aneurinibacillus thermoaerophilus]MED0737885.1 GntR family transcriptional regulator [Aneurinibacillus thermoaerophilus]MED0759160.1 GntR family transcriptional regulator [Aneurinibacillus thermoaerophilus]MED0762701.1 GntR family transcriptional regulator [Aneurinibacillus thermoaerophilus]